MDSRNIIDMALLIIATACIASNIKPKPQSDISERILEPDNTLGLRGAACLLVLCDHTSAEYGYSAFRFSGAATAGVTSVALFFFLAGYGLYMAYKHDSKQYFTRYPRNRLLYMIGTYTIMDASFWIVAHMRAKEHPFLFGLWDAITTGDFEAISSMLTKYRPHEWFAWSIIFMYIGAYLGMYLAKGHGWVLCLAAVTTAIAWITICTRQEIDIRQVFRYNAVHMFPIGMLFAQHREKIFNFAAKHIKIITASALAITAISSFISLQIYAISVTALILIATTRLSFSGRLLRFIGTTSLEIYLIQSVFTSGYPVTGSPVKNMPLNGLACVLCSILAGAAWHLVLKPFRVRICGRKN